MDLFAIAPGQGAGGQTYCVDVTMLIDATGSMSPIIERVKQDAMSFCDKFHQAMEANGKNVEQLRIKVISFRDYAYTDCPAMEESEFFALPEQNTDFRNFVSNIVARGGGDEPESALEAMALAMRSNWISSGSKRRHVILVFTDASAAPLGDSRRTGHSEYPANMPRTLAELGDMWAGCNQELGGMPEYRAARLVTFAPNVSPWCDLQTWNNVWPCFSKAGEGLAEFDIDAAIQLLVNSVSA